MDLQLKGKRALVTGSTAGIGYAIAESLAHEGVEVIVNGRTEARVLTALEGLNSITGQTALAARGRSPVGRAARDLRPQTRREEKAMLTHCVDEQRSMRAQTPAARRVAAARDHLLRCGSSEMEGIEFVGTPRIWPRGARNAAHATFASGC